MGSKWENVIGSLYVQTKTANNSISWKIYLLLNFSSYLPQIFRKWSLHDYKKVPFSDFKKISWLKKSFLFGFKNKKRYFSKKFLMQSFCNLIKIRLWKFEEGCLKIVGEDRFLMKLYLFALLVCALHREPIELSDFDPLHLKIYLEFEKSGKKQLVA